MDDVEVYFDVDGIVATDGDNEWRGKDFYEFLLNDVIALDENLAPVEGISINEETLKNVIALAEKYGARIDRVKFHATVGECTIGGQRVLLMKPTTLMNNSGIAVGEAAAFYKIPPERVLVLHDEISFDPGLIRIRRKGSAGGHNGLKSIIASIGSEDFPRIKIGVGKKPSPEYDLADFVLSKFPEDDMKKLTERFEDIRSATELIIKGEIDLAMQKYSK
jgi:PTH1 family peptidyl-tRNA hydrolase